MQPVYELDVETITAEAISIDVSALSTGMYTVVFNMDGEQVSKKFVVQE